MKVTSARSRADGGGAVRQAVEGCRQLAGRRGIQLPAGHHAGRLGSGSIATWK